MNKERLLKVAQRMEDVHIELEEGKAPIEFDLYGWGRLKKTEKFENREDLSCLTAACAIGYCGNLFKDEGFLLTMIRGLVLPVFEGKKNWDAVTSFFDVPTAVAYYFFQTDSYQFQDNEENENYQPMPAEVADRIRRYVRSGKIGKS